MRMSSMSKSPNDVALSCTIYHAENIDLYSNVTIEERNYCIVFWVEPGKECFTHIEKGLLDPVWKQSFRVPIERPSDYRFLNIEVIRFNSSAARPGTSNGIAAVGRAKIPLPEKISLKKQGRFGLVKLEGAEVKGEGHVSLSMELKNIHPSVYG
ncbi:hypothetical protein AB3S75_036493 [Citrus x aurantiifolia]